jgi:putative ABC transport system ATP-binding protein
MGTALEACLLTKTYSGTGKPFSALKEINLTIPGGEFLVITGPSGCGKSTLLHLLAGLDRPTSGQVLLKGSPIDHLSETKLAKMRRKEIGFVFQFFNLISNLSVAANIELPALLIRTSPLEAKRKREKLLQELGLSDKANSLPWQLSGGQQQRVALARALINQPTLLLADEPTGNLDSASAREVLELLKYYHQQGQTIVLVTHDEKIAQTAQRIILMRDGEIVGNSYSGLPSAASKREA